MQIVDLTPDHDDRIRQCAALMVEGFRDHWPDAWPDLESALEEVRSTFGDDRLSRVAVDGEVVLGWIGGHRQYEGHTWELHPLVVHADHRRQGIARALVADLEGLVRARGATTLWLGSDDEDLMTSAGGVDLYPDVPGHIAGLRNLKGHPFELYQRLGFTVVGLLPDANGPGKPDIFLAKRIDGR